MVLATLAFAPHLQELKLEKCAVASRSVALVQNFCSLRALYLDGVSGLVHDAHLAHLNAAFRGATALTSVYLGFTTQATSAPAVPAAHSQCRMPSALFVLRQLRSLAVLVPKRARAVAFCAVPEALGSLQQLQLLRQAVALSLELPGSSRSRAIAIAHSGCQQVAVGSHGSALLHHADSGSQGTTSCITRYSAETPRPPLCWRAGSSMRG